MSSNGNELEWEANASEMSSIVYNLEGYLKVNETRDYLSIVSSSSHVS